MKKYLLLGIVLILSSIVFADWTYIPSYRGIPYHNQNTLGYFLNTMTQTNNYKMYFTDNWVQYNFTNSQGGHINYGSNLLTIETSLSGQDVWEHNLIINYENDGYLRAYDGLNRSLIVEQYLGGVPSSTKGMQIHDVTTGDGLEDLFIVQNQNFTWYQFNKTSFVTVYTYGLLTTEDSMTFSSIQCLQNIDAPTRPINCWFMDENQTIYKFNSDTGIVTDYNNMQVPTKYSSTVTISNARPMFVWDIDNDNNKELIFISNTGKLCAFDVTNNVNKTSFGGTDGCVSLNIVGITTTPQIMYSNNDGATGEISVAYHNNYKMFNTAGNEIYSDTHTQLASSEVKLFMTDCDNNGELDVAIFYFSVANDNQIKCYPIYKSASGSISGLNDNYFVNFIGSGNYYNIVSADLDNDSYIDDIVAPSGLIIGSGTGYDTLQSFTPFDNDTFKWFVVDDINGDGLNEILAQKTGLSGLSVFISNYTIAPPTINGDIILCVNNPLMFGQEQRFQANFSDVQGNKVAKLGVDCDTAHSSGNIQYFLLDVVPTAYCNYTNIGIYTTKVCVTNTYFNGISADCKNINVEVSQSGNPTQDINGAWICTNYVYPSTNTTSHLNITEFDCATNPLYCQGNYADTSFDWTLCNGWTIMYPICPLWYHSTDAMSNAYTWIFSSSFYIALMFIITILIILIFYRIKR